VASRHALTLVALIVVVLAASAAAPLAASPTRNSGKAAVVVGKSRFGPILFDGRGYALYIFTHDTRRHATCYGVCAKAWPPYLVKSRPVARRGAKASLVGAVRRRDGRLQATYAGRPLYYYRGDKAPGVILCQNVPEFGGLWLVVRGTGKPVRS
jgi:predicted lipoprotein with Yx(FWY)xxD motif